MKINIVQDDKITETEITIVCNKVDNELEAIISNISIIGNTVAGKINDETFFINLMEVMYFETIDNKSFFYTRDNIYETPMKLYQLEEKLLNTPFVRVSKSVILNLKKVKSIKPEENSRLVAVLGNNEKVIISRQYMRNIKNKLGA